MDSNTPSAIPIKLCLFISIIIAISLYALYKWIKCRNDDTSPLKKKFRNFLGSMSNNNNNDNDQPNESNDFNTNHNNSYNTFQNNTSFSNCSNKSSSFNNDSNDNVIPSQKIARFAIDYCRTSPNITHIQKDIVDIGWRNNVKYHYSVNIEHFNQLSEKAITNSVMTIIPLFNFSVFNLEDSSSRSSCSKLIIDLSSNHPSFIQYTHFVILNTPKILIKITPLYTNGSIRDLIYNTDPLVSYNKKCNKKGTPLSLNQILLFSQQILRGLAYLHSNNWYHLNLHSGNILLNAQHDKCFINDLENSLLELPIRNEKYLHYIYDFFNNESVFNQGNSNNNTILSEILISINVFEKIDVVLFGRLLYEMIFGKELLENCPDEKELNEVSPKLKQVLNIIFPKKLMNGKVTLSLPERSAIELLIILLNKSYQSEDDIDELKPLIENDKYNWIKERVFRQSVFIKKKLKELNDIEIDINISNVI